MTIHYINMKSTFNRHKVTKRLSLTNTNRNIFVVPPRSFFLFNNKLNIIKIAPPKTKALS